MKHFKPNVVRGGRAIGLGNNLFLMKGRKHSEGGIDVGENPRTGLEVEDNEVMQVSPKGVKVFSAQPILGGKSPAQYVLEGASPYNVFNAQEDWKKFNGVNDDGTQKKIDNRKEYVTRRLEDYDIFDDDTLALRQRFMESNFVNDSISPTGAKGAYQIMPHIYNAYVKRTGKKGDLTNYEYNKSIRDWLLAEDIAKNKKLMHDDQLPIVKLAKQYGAYNWGSGNLQKYLNNQVAKGIDINNSLDWLEGLPRETRDYINFIVLGKDANKYKTNSIYNQTLKTRGIKELGGDDENEFGIRRTAYRDNTATVLSPDTNYVPELTNEQIERIKNGRLDDGVLGFVPVLGDILQGAQAITDINNGKYALGAIGLGSLLLPNTIEKTFKGVKNLYKSRKYLRQVNKQLDKLYDVKTPAEMQEIENRLLRNGANGFKGDIVTASLYKDRKSDFNFIKEGSKIVKDLKSGHKFSLITDGALSTDSYPLYTLFLEKQQRNGLGKVSPVIDNNNIYRMMKLNKDGKYYDKKKIDDYIARMREYLNDENIPDRISIFGNTYVPAFDFYKYKYGGIHIKPSKRGTFTAAAKKHGMSVQGFASKVLANKDNYSPSMVKKANFARNASKWHKKEFGGQLNNNDMTFDYLLGSNRQLYKLGGCRKKAQNGIYVDGKLYNRKGEPLFSTDIEPAVVTSTNNSIPKLNYNINEKAISSNANYRLNNRNQRIAKVSNNIGYFQQKSDTASLNKETLREKGNPIKLNIGLNDISKLGLDEKALVSNIIGNTLATGINAIAVGSRQFPRNIPLRAIKQNTEYNVEPELNSTRETVAKNERDITDNTASSRVAVNRRQLARNLGNRALNEIYGQKENFENDLVRRNLANIQNIGNQNITNINKWLADKATFNNEKIDDMSEVLVTGINNTTDAIGDYAINKRKDKQYRMNLLLEFLKSPYAVDAINSEQAKQIARNLGIIDEYNKYFNV